MAGNNRFSILAVLVALVCYNQACETPPRKNVKDYTINEFQPTDGEAISLLTSHRDSDNVFVAGSSTLYQLSTNLVQKNKVSDVNKTRDIRIMEVSENLSSLITCAAAGLRGCQVRTLVNVSVEKEVENINLKQGVIPTLNGSIVGLIAHGVDADKESLYLARPASALSSPIIERRLETSNGETDRGTNNLIRDDFPIYYRKALFYNDFVYFVASQRFEPENTRFVSKLSRLCPSAVEENLPTFTEIKLVCKVDGDDGSIFQLAQAAQVHDNWLYVVFNKNMETTSYRPGNQSALCVYNMTEIERELTKAAKQCGCSKDGSNNNYLRNAQCEIVFDEKENNQVCLTPKFLANEYTLPCDSFGFFLYPEQVAANASEPLFVWNKTFSSVAITRTGVTDHLVAFIGTREGQLLKVNLEEEICSPYEQVDFDAAILSDTTFADEDEEQLLVITESKVHKIMTSNCGLFTTCEECIRPRSPLVGDPYCGWCTLSKRCTQIEECDRNEELSRWLPYDEMSCAAISEVSPSSLSVEAASEKLMLTVEHLPALAADESYQCRFGASYQGEALVVEDNRLSCTSPPRNVIPAVSEGNDHVIVPLRVYSSETDTEFVSKNYQFYDCSKIKSCSLCVNSDWRCDWCKFSHSCTHDNSTCGSDTIITGSYQSTNSSTAADESCPQIVPGDLQYVPNGVDRVLEFRAKHLPPVSNDRVQGYTCHLTAQDNDDAKVDFMVEAQIRAVGDDEFVITCGSKMYSYGKDLQELSTHLSLTWNANNLIDGDQPVTLYKCDSGRPDCSRCLSDLSTDVNLNCVWCESQRSCTFESQCSGRLEVCPAPTITRVFPNSAPLGGNTVVVINGTNLGQSYDEITSISLAGRPCEKLNETYYKVGESIQCRAQGSQSEIEGDVVVVVKELEGRLANGFNYNEPYIIDFNPKKGPRSGGTVVTFTGVKLDTGEDVEVLIQGTPCLQVGARTARQFSCETMGREMVNADVKVTIDEDSIVEIRLDNQIFQYLQDPVVTKVEPLKAIKSGGLNLMVTGKHFDLIQVATVIAKSQPGKDAPVVEGECTIPANSRKTMTCASPNVTDLMEAARRRRRRQTEDQEGAVPILIGFRMDGVTSLEDWSEKSNMTFEAFPDPSYDRFDNEVLEFTRSLQKTIEIRGSNIDIATEKDQVKVLVGDQICEITVFGENLILCTPPSTRPEPVNRFGQRTENNLPLVQVLHGSTLVFEIGYVQYLTDPIIFYIVAVGLALLLIILIAVVIICCLRKSKNKQLRKLEMELRELPKDISEELRVLFATLQTAMSKFGTNPEGLPELPLIDRSEFVKNMLFLNLAVQPPTEPLMASEEIDAMKKFSELIYNKSFLLVFIRTLDREKSLPMMDRVNIASLITLAILLEGKLDYLTDVMVTLMGEEIEDLVEKNRPKQLFKRNESIMEKLVSNWVALCLYNYLEKCGAKKIGQLYSAIQCLIEKGPIDAISGKSQFSLDNEHMLDSQVSFEEVTLQVVANEEDGEIASVTVLDVDTITQVKTKILDFLHRGRPYSARTSTTEMDLEWRQGLSGQLVLRDDGNQEVIDGWKKINTLRDYKVESGCRVALIKRQANPNATLASKSELVSAANSDEPDYNESAFMDLSLAEKTPLNRSPTLVEARVEEGVNLWHLIKEIEAADELHGKSKNRLQQKGIKEVLLPFLTTTRDALETYVTAAFDVMLSTDSTESPRSIKYLFDYFDRQAAKYNLDSPDIINAWKNNVLPLRFWTTLLASPTYIFDVRHSTYVEACLKVLVQVLRDACNKDNFKLDKNSSPSRLLYHSMLPKYSEKVETFYRHIQELPRLNPDATKEEFSEISQPFSGLFDATSTMFQLYQFAKRFNESLNAALEDDDDCQNANLVYRMEQVGITLNE